MLNDLFFWYTVAAVVVALCFLLRGLKIVRSVLFVRGFIAIATLCAALIVAPGISSLNVRRYAALVIVLVAGLVFLCDLLLGFGQGMKRAISRNNPFTRSLPEYLTEICQAMQELTNHNIGALVVVEGKENLENYIDAGIPLDSTIKAEALGALFLPESPVHDGAVVVRNGRIAKIKAILPLSTNENISLSRGTRHRSAIGITEKSDAIVFVVSEERGEFSIGYRGALVKVESDQQMIKLVRMALQGRSIVKGGN
jgi:diadenylate cyclase